MLCCQTRGTQDGRARGGCCRAACAVLLSVMFGNASVRAPFRTWGEATVPARPQTEQYFLSGLLSGERAPHLPLAAIAAILSYSDTPNRQIIRSTRSALDDPSELITADLYFVFQGAEQSFQGRTANGSCGSFPPATEALHCSHTSRQPDLPG